MAAPTLVPGGIPNQPTSGTLPVGQAISFDTKPYWVQSEATEQLLFGRLTPTYITMASPWVGALGESIEFTLVPTVVIGTSQNILSLGGNPGLFRVFVGNMNLRVSWKNTLGTATELPVGSPYIMTVGVTYLWKVVLTTLGVEIWLNGTKVREDINNPPNAAADTYSIDRIGGNPTSFDGYIRDVKLGIGSANADKRTYLINDKYAPGNPNPIVDSTGTAINGTAFNTTATDWSLI